MANFHHNNRYRGRGRKNNNAENREHQEGHEIEKRDNKPGHDQQEARAMYRERRERENREARERDNREQRDNRDNREQRDSRDRREHRENNESRNNRESRDNQAINTFTLGSKELEGKNAQFQYDKGWYSIIDIVGEEKSIVYKSKNAQEAYTKWNVYIGRKKERSQRVEKAEN